MTALIRPLLSSNAMSIVLPDGEADIYGWEPDGDGLVTGMMLNHIGGRVAWDLLVEIAKVGRFAIHPIGCAMCFVDEADLRHAPAEFSGPTRVISSGAELLEEILAN